jgi:hypothetical protein
MKVMDNGTSADSRNHSACRALHQPRRACETSGDRSVSGTDRSTLRTQHEAPTPTAPGPSAGVPLLAPPFRRPFHPPPAAVGQQNRLPFPDPTHRLRRHLSHTPLHYRSPCPALPCLALACYALPCLPLPCERIGCSERPRRSPFPHPCATLHPGNSPPLGCSILLLSRPLHRRPTVWLRARRCQPGTARWVATGGGARLVRSLQSRSACRRTAPNLAPRKLTPNPWIHPSPLARSLPPTMPGVAGPHGHGSTPLTGPALCPRRVAPSDSEGSSTRKSA